MKRNKQKPNKLNKDSLIKFNNKDYLFLLLRYLALLIILISLPLLYNLLTIITFNPLVFLLKLFYEVSVNNNLIVLNTFNIIRIIPACVAGAAYILLLILNLTIKMSIKKRIYSILFSITLLYLLNISRLLIFSYILVAGYDFFDILHKITWYFLSLVFVIGIWFLTAKIFSIKQVPIYTDLKSIINNIKK